MRCIAMRDLRFGAKSASIACAQGSPLVERTAPNQEWALLRPRRFERKTPPAQKPDSITNEIAENNGRSPDSPSGSIVSPGSVGALGCSWALPVRFTDLRIPVSECRGRE